MIRSVQIMAERADVRAVGAVMVLITAGVMCAHMRVAGAEGAGAST